MSLVIIVIFLENTKALWIILLLVLGSFLVGQDQFVQSLTDLCFQVKHIIKKEEKNRAWLWFYLLVVDWKEADLNESLQSIVKKFWIVFLFGFLSVTWIQWAIRRCH